MKDAVKIQFEVGGKPMFFESGLLAQQAAGAVSCGLGDNIVFSAVTGPNINKGEAEEVLEVEYQGDPVELGFNSQYLLEFLNVVETPQVSFEFTDENIAGMFRPAGDLDYAYKYIVMPMSI